jgi:imidazole glycerol-phosphate synthase subunit HisH
MVVIVDYGMGNLRSVQNKLKRIGFYSEISSDPGVIEKADKLILPGVGHFANGMKKLSERNLINILNIKVLKGKIPILGICLGMQLIGTFSEEGLINGLGWIDAKTIRFRIPDSDKYRFKVPHIGWNNVNTGLDSKLFREVPPDAQFYFVHSYHYVTNDISLLTGTTNYCYDFVSCVEKDNIYGTQFHPEKSQDFGMQLLKNFVNL